MANVPESNSTMSGLAGQAFGPKASVGEPGVTDLLALQLFVGAPGPAQARVGGRVAAVEAARVRLRAVEPTLLEPVLVVARAGSERDRSIAFQPPRLQFDADLQVIERGTGGTWTIRSSQADEPAIREAEKISIRVPAIA